MQRAMEWRTKVTPQVQIYVWADKVTGEGSCAVRQRAAGGGATSSCRRWKKPSASFTATPSRRAHRRRKSCSAANTCPRPRVSAAGVSCSSRRCARVCHGVGEAALRACTRLRPRTPPPHLCCCVNPSLLCCCANVLLCYCVNSRTQSRVLGRSHGPQTAFPRCW
jgi:hypothetical protein